MSIKLPLISVNGVLDALISPMDRGFAYGDGVFETCRYSNGVIPLWDFHYERLLNSAERLKIPLDKAQLTHYLGVMLACLRENRVAQAVVKITLTRGAGGRGYRFPAESSPTYCIGVFPGSPLQSPHSLAGVDIRICNARLAQIPALAGMKHLNRLEHIIARAEWGDEYAEGLLLDAQDRVIEATVSNVFAVKNDQLYSPELSQSGVAGVMRKTIIGTLAPDLGVDCRLIDMDLDFLYTANEVFLCNSVYGIWPVNNIVDDRDPDTIDRHSFTNHQITGALQQKLALLLGE